jgi:hypothetical protein
MRKICEIAWDIKREWGGKVHYAAKPYLQAMLELDTVQDKYYEDDARSIVLYFLSNASTFRGEVAKLLKAELKEVIK